MENDFIVEASSKEASQVSKENPKFSDSDIDRMRQEIECLKATVKHYATDCEKITEKRDAIKRRQEHNLFFIKKCRQKFMDIATLMTCDPEDMKELDPDFCADQRVLDIVNEIIPELEKVLK